MPAWILDLSTIVIVNWVIQLTGLVVLVALFIHGYRELHRLGRATAGLVYQENEKTRERIDEIVRQTPR